MEKRSDADNYQHIDPTPPKRRKFLEWKETQPEIEALKKSIENSSLKEKSKKYESFYLDNRKIINSFQASKIDFCADIECDDADSSKKTDAAAFAIDKTNEEFYGKSDDDDVENDDDEESANDDDDECYPVATKKGVKGTISENNESFITLLQCCVHFDQGFQIEGDSGKCWCPCGSYMKPWQDLFGVNVDKDDDACSNRKGKQVKVPSALLHHLYDNRGSELHYGVYNYLLHLYREHPVVVNEQERRRKKEE